MLNLKLKPRFRTETDFAELAFQQLSKFFPQLEKDAQLHLQGIPDIQIDLLARSANRQLVLFEIKYVLPNRSLGFSTYPSVAALQDTVREFLPEKSPIVVVLSTGSVDEPVRDVFKEAGIPVVELSTKTEETIERLKEAFKYIDLDLPEITGELQMSSRTQPVNLSAISDLEMGDSGIFTNTDPSLSYGQQYELQKEALRSLERLRQRLAEIEDLNRTKSKFMAIAAQELIPPLNVMVGYANLLADMDQLPLEAKNISQGIVNTSDRMRRLIDDIPSGLNWFVHQKQVDKTVDISKLVSEVITELRQQAKFKSVDIVLKSEPNLPLIQGDEYLLKQVIRNLLDNAIKYTPTNESIRVEALLEDSQVTVKVTDRGPGIPRELQSAIFEPFSPFDHGTLEKRHGSGLGLAIVKAAINMHHGHIEVESEPGKGSTFIISFSPYEDATSDR